MPLVINIRGGYCIEWDEYPKFSYEGRDGYIARFKHNATPFENREIAERLVQYYMDRQEQW